MNVTCTTDDCPENGIPKTAEGLEAEAEAGEIVCGACGQPTTPDDA